MSHVFISYSHEDRDYARKLAGYLLAQGFDIWIDDRIDFGDEWWDKIVLSIQECAAFVVLMTPDSHSSKWVKREVLFADQRDKQMFPVLLEGDNWPIFGPTQYADVRGGSLPPDGFCERLAKVALHQKRRRTKVTPAQETPRPYLPFEPETVPVPAGPFLMGSYKAKDPQSYEDELPQHTVTLPDYRIGKYPVTVGEYRVFIEAGGYHEQHWWTEAGWTWRKQENRIQPHLWDYEQWTGNDRLPVVGVTWFEAYAYGQWLAEVTPRTYRLPTEAEWEKAARGTDGRIYPWGNEWQVGLCNSHETGIKHTTPVGVYSPAGDSPYGAVDMAGNVWEWTGTMYREYPYNARDGRENDSDASAGRVLRGGAWFNNQNYARAAYRDIYLPSGRDNINGFRVVVASPIT